MKEVGPMSAPFKKRLGGILFRTDTLAGKLFNAGLLLLVLASVGVVMLDSAEPVAARYQARLYGLEWFFTLIFTVEYAARLWSARNRKRYAFSFHGVIDLLSVLPTYAALLIPGTEVFLAVRVLRLFRIFRVMKLVSYQGEARFILHALSLSRRKIVVFLYAVVLLVVILGSAMYVIEGHASGFTSISRSIYWAIVTLTTVGYGDISPQTALGQALAAFVMLLGYSIIAVPTGIVTAEIHTAHRLGNAAVTCPNCPRQMHEQDAHYCRLCGARLQVPGRHA